MTIHKNNETADKVLSIIEKKCNSKTIYCEPYQNGRESGWKVWLSTYEKFAVFSEFRRSDDIVIYTGSSMDFSMQGNAPSDEVYNNKTLFAYNEEEKAADYVINYLFSKESNMEYFKELRYKSYFGVEIVILNTRDEIVGFWAKDRTFYVAIPDPTISKYSWTEQESFAEINYGKKLGIFLSENGYHAKRILFNKEVKFLDN